jgi:hypothetical protein
MRSIAVLVLFTSGCSVVTGDLSPGECTRYEDCDALNVRDRLDARTCELWTCRFPASGMTGTCERGPRDRDGDGAPGPSPSAMCGYETTDCDDFDRLRDGRAEACDGADNDCDLAIDEAIEPGTFVGTPSALGTIGSDGTLRFAASSELALAMLATSTPTGLGSSFVPLMGESMVLPATYETYCGEAAPRAGCGIEGCSLVSTGCSVGQPALDRAGDGAIVAAVNLTGCPSGELRIGRHDGLGRVEIDSAGSAAFGAPTCTGQGVRAPAVASLDPSMPIGPVLVAHYVEPWNATRACGAEVGVRAVRLRGATSAVGRSGRFELEGTIELGRAGSTTPPAIAPLPDRSGWIVAYGRAAGGLELVRVSAAGEHRVVATVEGGATASSIVMQAGPTALGLAWIEGCDGGTARFAMLRGETVEGPTTIEATARDLAIAALPAGLVETGFTRDGRTAQELDRGGFLVVTRDASALRAHRLLALDARPIGEAQSVAVDARAVGLVRPMGASTLPFDALAWRANGELARVSLGCAR